MVFQAAGNIVKNRVTGRFNVKKFRLPSVFIRANLDSRNSSRCPPEIGQVPPGWGSRRLEEKNAGLNLALPMSHERGQFSNARSGTWAVRMNEYDQSRLILVVRQFARKGPLLWRGSGPAWGICVGEHQKSSRQHQHQPGNSQAGDQSAGPWRRPRRRPEAFSRLHKVIFHRAIWLMVNIVHDPKPRRNASGTQGCVFSAGHRRADFQICLASGRRGARGCLGVPRGATPCRFGNRRYSRFGKELKRRQIP